MAKNFATLYASANPVTALSQKIFIKKEVSRGVLIAPAGTDFMWHQEGAAMTISQGKNPSPHKSGRHNDAMIFDKITGEWTIPAFININTLVAQGATEVDAAVQTLWESALGKKTIPGGVVFTAEDDPSITFSILECGDKWSNQIFGAAVEDTSLELPGDGQAKVTWSGRCKNGYLVGISKSSEDNDGGNVVTLDTPNEAKRFPVGALVMLVEANGTTRSADTPTGTPRVVTASDALTGAVTVSGAVLADADGSGPSAPIYLCYYEPETPTAINNPQTGLKGSITVDNMPGGFCFRGATISLKNNHEWEEYCYGKDTLGDDIFIAGGRLQVDVSLNVNFRQSMIEYLNDKRSFTADALVLILGDVASRHLKVELPKVIYDLSGVSIPANGSVPMELKGIAVETSLDEGDEITVSYL